MDRTRAPADGRRGSGPRPLALAGAATVVLAALALLSLRLLPDTPDSLATATASGTVGPTVVPTLPGASTSSTPGPTPFEAVSVPWPTLPRADASVPTSLDGLDVAFWTLEDVIPCCGSKLRVATSGAGRVDAVEVPGLLMSPEFRSLPAGPAAGRVVYVMDDGRVARLMVADSRTGEHAELLSSTMVIAKVAIDPRGATAYYLLFDRRSSAFLGLWAVSTTGGDPRPLSLVGPPAATAILAATRVYIEPQLVVSDQGGWIAVVTCDGVDCELAAIHADGSGVPLHSASFGAGDTIVGIAGDLLIGTAECQQAICDGFALDLLTDERWPLGGSEPFPPAQLIAGPRGPMVLRENPDFERGLWRVEALDLTSGGRGVVLEARFEPGVTDIRLATAYHAAAAELPPGWYLVYRNADPVAMGPPDYSAASVPGAVETALPIMKPSRP